MSKAAMNKATPSKATSSKATSSKGGKTVAFKVPAPRLASGADAWIASRGAEVTGGLEASIHPTPGPVAAEPATLPREKMARFTIDVPESLHRRIKTQCASRGTKMADMMRALLEREFPEA